MNKTIIFLLIIAIAAAIAAMFVWPGLASDSLDDLHTWFRHFSGPTRRQ